MNINDVILMMDKFESSSLSEFKLDMDGIKLRCSKDIHTKKDGGNNSDEVTERIINPEIKPEIKSDTQLGKEENAVEIKAVVPGTFYRAKTPESEPFVQVGQKVKKGEILGMIEAMKMMNEISSPVDGTIEEIVAKNEEVVGFEDMLMKIRE